MQPFQLKRFQLMMVGAQRGRSATRRECTNAMHHPGLARWTHSEDSHSEDSQTLVLGLAHLCLTMEFIYQVTIQVYNTLACVSVFVLATGIASCDYSSNAFLKEAAASKQAMPGSASVAAKAKSGDYNSDTSSQEAVETMVPQKAIPSSAGCFAKAKSAKAKRLMVIAVGAIAHTCLCLSLLSISTFTMNGLHGGFKEQARRNFESSDGGLNESAAQDWGVLFRAGGRWHGEPANVTWKAQALPATCGRR